MLSSSFLQPLPDCLLREEAASNICTPVGPVVVVDQERVEFRVFGEFTCVREWRKTEPCACGQGKKHWDCPRMYNWQDNNCYRRKLNASHAASPLLCSPSRSFGRRNPGMRSGRQISSFSAWRSSFFGRNLSERRRACDQDGPGVPAIGEESEARVHKWLA